MILLKSQEAGLMFKIHSKAVHLKYIKCGYKNERLNYIKELSFFFLPKALIDTDTADGLFMPEQYSLFKDNNAD